MENSEEVPPGDIIQNPPRRRQANRRVDLNEAHHYGVRAAKNISDLWERQMMEMQFMGPLFEESEYGPKVQPLPASIVESGLPPLLIKNLMESELKYKELSPLQRFSIPALRFTSDNDPPQHLIVNAPTGSGKTMAFLIPAIRFVQDVKRVDSDVQLKNLPVVVVVSNTNNLCTQTYRSACLAAGFVQRTNEAAIGVTCYPLFKAANLNERGDRFALQGHIVIASMGMLMHAMERQIIKWTSLRLLIIDEADLLTSNDFGEQLLHFYTHLPESVKTRLRICQFSATYGYTEGQVEVNRVAASLMGFDQEHEEEGDEQNVNLIIQPPTLGYIKQRIYWLNRNKETSLTPTSSKFFSASFHRKLKALELLLEYDRPKSYNKETGLYDERCVIFVEKVVTSSFVSAYLQQRGFDVYPVNSHFDHHSTDETLKKLAAGEFQGVVTTNKLARGQDIPGVKHVIIFEMSADFNNYKHRIGRTGRAGHGGVASVLMDLNMNELGLLIPLRDFLEYHKQYVPPWLRAYTDQQEQSLAGILSHRVAQEQDAEVDDDDTDLGKLPNAVE